MPCHKHSRRGAPAYFYADVSLQKQSVHTETHLQALPSSLTCHEHDYFPLQKRKWLCPPPQLPLPSRNLWPQQLP